MREIRFRAWDTELNDWADWQDNFIGQDSRLHLKNGHAVELEQFTGLLDKKGKEIYEGDIVRGANGFLAYIDFEDGAFQIRAHQNALIDPIEVIGNIHENAELLK
jgi:hypothetical protein